MAVLLGPPFGNAPLAQLVEQLILNSVSIPGPNNTKVP
jgi:hypothetical protein